MTRSHLAALISCLVAPTIGLAQTPPPANPPPKAAPNPMQVATQQDHKKMMDLLKIEKLRPGANGMNRQAANAANYDESKANPYPKLPDPLTLKSGEKVTTADAWWTKRRPEIVEDFAREVYGRVPSNVPKVTWEVASTTEEKVGDIPAITKKLVGHVDNARCPEIAGRHPAHPDHARSKAKGPVPVMMEFGFAFVRPPTGRDLRPSRRPQRRAMPREGEGHAQGWTSGRAAVGGPTWQQQVLAKGWGYAIIVPNSIQADNGAGLTKGIIGLCNKGQARKPDDWGSLRAWAWGASRALDYFETDKSVDAEAGRDRGALALRQGGARRDGV